MLAPRDLPLLAVFAVVARNGSFTAAARELGVAKSVVSDQVRALEDRCGVRLLSRSTRRLELTQVGEAVLAATAVVVQGVREVEAVLDEHRDAAVGTLRVATTHDLGPRLVVPVAARLAERHPDLSIDVTSDDAQVDLIAGRFDVAVRLGAPRDSGYVMRKLGAGADVIVAAPSRADAAGPASRPRDLSGAPWVRHALLSRGDTFAFRGPRGERDEIRAHVRAVANTSDNLRALILAGLGIGVLPDYLAADDLRRGALVRLCPDWVAGDLSLYALLPSGRRPPRRVTLFLDALKEALARILGGGAPG